MKLHRRFSNSCALDRASRPGYSLCRTRGVEGVRDGQRHSVQCQFVVDRKGFQGRASIRKRRRSTALGIDALKRLAQPVPHSRPPVEDCPVAVDLDYGSMRPKDFSTASRPVSFTYARRCGSSRNRSLAKHLCNILRAPQSVQKQPCECPNVAIRRLLDVETSNSRTGELPCTNPMLVLYEESQTSSTESECSSNLALIS